MPRAHHVEDRSRLIMPWERPSRVRFHFASFVLGAATAAVTLGIAFGAVLAVVR